MRDLVILVPDRDMEAGVGTLLTARREALGIRQVTFDIFIHPQRDSGVFGSAHSFLRPLLNQYRYALVLLDRWGCGSHEDAQSIARTVTRRLEQNGWQNRCGVVVADPELEMWIWSPSPNVERILGWRGTPSRMAEWLRAQGLLHGSKPDEPKRALRAVLVHTRTPQSSRLFARLAETVSLQHCRDPNFNRLKAILRNWFSSGSAAPAGPRG